MVQFLVPVATSSGSVQLPILAGEVLLIAGPNGAGKSSLLHTLARSLGGPQSSETFSGHRQIHFASDDIDTIGMSIEQLRTQMSQNPANFGRARGNWGEQHLKSVVRRVVNQQNQDNNDLTDQAELTGQSVKELAREKPRTLRRLNDIFAAGRLSVELVLDQGVLKARRDNNLYGIDLLSDGERAALLIVGAILIRPAGTVILIDEPERHLNPNIAGPLISAAVSARPEISFVFASHELSLIESLRATTIVHVESSHITATGPNESRTYELQVVKEEDQVPEELRYSVLGARRAVLMVEGETFSDDQAVYSRLYPDHHILPRGGADSVIGNVRSIRDSAQFHWLRAEGIIDGDGRGSDERAELANDGIHALRVPTIENLFLHPVILRQMAGAMSELLGGATASECLDNAMDEVERSLEAEMGTIVDRRVVWDANRELSARKISVKTARATGLIASVDVAAIRVKQEAEVNALRSKYRGLRIIGRMPIKNTKIPAVIVKAIGYDSFKAYKRAVLRQMQSDTKRGRLIFQALRRLAPQLQIL